jgi:hypothetical protein
MIRSDHSVGVREIIAAGFDINSAVDEKGSALRLAVASSAWNCCVALIELGADVNNPIDRYVLSGESLLHMTVRSRDWKATKLLLENGADVCACDSHNIQPLHQLLASSMLPLRWIELARLLLDHGADANAPTQWTAPWQFAWGGTGPYGTRTPKTIFTPLHGALAAICSPANDAGRGAAREMLSLLLEFGADPSCAPDNPPKNYLSPIHLAARLGAAEELGILLVSPRADREQLTGDGRTLVQIAIAPAVRELVRADRVVSSVALAIDADEVGQRAVKSKGMSPL